MRVVITGATGNIGTSLLRRLSGEAAVREIVGIARRPPSRSFSRTRFERADVASDPLHDLMRGADAVVHLAWRLQPSHDLASLERTNVEGSARIFEAALRADVRTIVYASSYGAYAPGPKDREVDESWSTAGVETATYSRQKARVERLLDDLEEASPDTRVVRMRPGLVFKREAASGMRRLFLGPLVPRWAFQRGALRVIPDHPRLRPQAVHSMDVAEAFWRALRRDVRGPFNLVADPVLDPELLSRLFGARRVRLSRNTMRRIAAVTWQMRLQPSEPGWVDLALDVPLISNGRAAEELDWRPRWRADEALVELIEGLHRSDGLDTPPLAPRRGTARMLPADPESWLAGAS